MMVIIVLFCGNLKVMDIFSLGHIEGESAGNPEETLLSSVSIREEGVTNSIDHCL